MKNTIKAFLRKKLRKEKTEFICLSPPCGITQLIVHTTITITYKRPAARGRKIFGSLIPFGAMWKTGAGVCTTIHFSNPVSINETVIPAGHYALFTIPDVHNWVIILNSDYQQEGFNRYDAGKDILRFEVPAMQTARFYESFSIDMDVVNNTAGIIYLSWEQVQVCFSVTVSLPEDADYLKRLQEL